MKNLGTLFRYEMKKIWKRPLLWAALLLFCAIFVYTTARPFLPTKSGTTFTWTGLDGNEISRYITGNEQYRIRVEGARKLSGQVMDEEFFRKGRESVPPYGERFQKDCWFMLVDPSYAEFSYNWSEWLEGTAEDFYDSRKAGIKMNLEKYCSTPEEAAYWENLEVKVEKPFVYQPVTSVEELTARLGSGGLTILTPILAGVCLCELFASERRTKMDALMFSSRRGRRTLYLAKILAGGLSAMLAVLAVVGAFIGAELALYGTWGWDGAIQLQPWLWACLHPLTSGQGIGILVVLLLIYALLCGALTAAVSVFTGSGVAALAVSVGVMLLTMRPNNVGGWMEFLPANLVDQHAFASLTLTDLFGLKLDLFQSGALLYAVIAIVLLAFCWLGWRRWVVAGK